MTRKEDTLSVMQAVNLQLDHRRMRRAKEDNELLEKLNRAVSTPPPSERDLALKRHIEEREREGTIHSTEWGD